MLLLPALLALAAGGLSACGADSAETAPDANSAPVGRSAPLPTVVDTTSGDTLVVGAAQTSDEVLTLQAMAPDDRACTLTLRGAAGTRTELADLEFCERDDLVGQRVTLTTVATQLPAASCGTNPACTDTETVNLVIAADLADEVPGG